MITIRHAAFRYFLLAYTMITVIKQAIGFNIIINIFSFRYMDTKFSISDIDVKKKV
jgi:hypothetical protein